MKIAIQPYVYYHTQCPGYQVRQTRVNHHGERVTVSRFFSVTKMGSLLAARRRAIWWRQRNLA